MKFNRLHFPKITPRLAIVWSMSVFITMTSNISVAWNHEVSLGYGSGHEYGQSYLNTGFYASANLHRFSPIDPKLYVSVLTGFGVWHAHTFEHQYNETLSVALDFRAYFYQPGKRVLAPYLQFSFGPAYLFHQYLGVRKQGAHFAFESQLGGGVEWKLSAMRRIDIGVGLMHYCNAGIFYPNEGYNIPLFISAGYQF